VEVVSGFSVLLVVVVSGFELVDVYFRSEWEDVLVISALTVVVGEVVGLSRPWGSPAGVTPDLEVSSPGGDPPGPGFPWAATWERTLRAQRRTDDRRRCIVS
jgi:hypothetical protein